MIEKTKKKPSKIKIKIKLYCFEFEDALFEAKVNGSDSIEDLKLKIINELKEEEDFQAVKEDLRLFYDENEEINLEDEDKIEDLNLKNKGEKIFVYFFVNFNVVLSENNKSKKKFDEFESNKRISEIKKKVLKAFKIDKNEGNDYEIFYEEELLKEDLTLDNYLKVYYIKLNEKIL